jgi:GTP-binding protein
VAIVGYPNSGKSTLFNRLTESREAVVEPTAGVTRDRKEGLGEWRSRFFVAVDTGGMDFAATEPLADQMAAQARYAIEEADAVVFVVDGTQPVGPQLHEIAHILHRSRAPVILAVNKTDRPPALHALHDFWELDLGEPLPISAEHGLGIGDLLDAVFDRLPVSAPSALTPGDVAAEVVRVAIVGRPNVGKSSLVNALLGSDRVIVSPLPGTTRDSIDTRIEYHGRAIDLVDTAGLRRKAKRAEESIEFFSSLRAVRAMERSDVALVLVDASEGLVDLDLQVAYEAQRAKCATAVLFNKWDMADMDLQKAKERIFTKVQMRPPVLTISALTGRNLGHVLPMALSLYERYSTRIPTADLNRWLGSLRERGVPQKSGKKLKLFYAVQYDAAPPRFKVMINSRALITRNYGFFLENRLREAFAMWGIPLIIDFEGKEERYT